VEILPHEQAAAQKHRLAVIATQQADKRTGGQADKRARADFGRATTGTGVSCQND
jgi:hypothetical protein